MRRLKCRYLEAESSSGCLELDDRYPITKGRGEEWLMAVNGGHIE